MMEVAHQPYDIILPATSRVPILISIPHSGIEIPADIKTNYLPQAIEHIDDTDFYVDQLYNFASELDIIIIKAKYSRWVVDLNRSPQNTNLYDDGRIITSLTPTTAFDGSDIYKNENHQPNQEQIKSRIRLYYEPYHQKVKDLLIAIRDQFGTALLWDAHSIRRHVPTIQKEPFPDMILGTNDETSASKELIDVGLESLQSYNHTVTHNTPFKGGHITRSFGDPEKNIHALQLEMSKDCYMDDAELKYDQDRASAMQKVLRHTLCNLNKKLRCL